ncbi:hypothetical protein [Marinivivus vitaminiproducens]|uniref:hypothetical protein n=1 Tax=Marinivivus vitaminiproducens TaxID=3035935 RepID=UPI002799C4E2|nr:hypothetical protein P4R82_19100 [Geminicoccaceae bacterium SCSIO 64248]
MRKKTAQQKTVTRKLAKPARWTVRGVAPELQKRAGDLARAEGLPVGVWLSALIDRATRAAARQETTDLDWRQAIEARLARIEERTGLAAETSGPGSKEDGTAEERSLAPARDGQGRHLRERGMDDGAVAVVPERVE